MEGVGWCTDRQGNSSSSNGKQDQDSSSKPLPLGEHNANVAAVAQSPTVTKIPVKKRPETKEKQNDKEVGVFGDAAEEESPLKDFFLSDPGTTFTVGQAVDTQKDQQDKAIGKLDKAPSKVVNTSRKVAFTMMQASSSSGRGRGMGRTLPAWMTRGEQQQQGVAPAAVGPETTLAGGGSKTAVQKPTVHETTAAPKVLSTVKSAAAPSTNTNTAILSRGGGMGRGMGRTLPAWMTKQQDREQQALAKPFKSPSEDGEILENERKREGDEHAVNERNMEDADETTPNNSTETQTTEFNDSIQQQASQSQEGERRRPSLEVSPEIMGQLPPLLRGICIAASRSGTIYTGKVNLFIKECAVCEEWKEKTDFPKAQWKGDDDKKRACKLCFSKHSKKEIQTILGELPGEPKKPNGPAKKKDKQKSTSSVQQKKEGKKRKQTTSIYGPADADEKMGSKPTTASDAKDTKVAAGHNKKRKVQEQMSIYGPSDANQETKGGKPVATSTSSTCNFADDVKAAITSTQHVPSSVNRNSSDYTSQQPKQQPPVAVATSLPEGWSEHWDDRYGQYYYHNVRDGSTQWTRPIGAPASSAHHR